jgi:predicted metal-dependent hydrolase
MPAVQLQKLLQVPELGLVTITKRKRCRRLCIRVNAKEVKVSIPFRSSYSDGEKFLFEKFSWIKETTIRLSKNLSAKKIIDESYILFTQYGTIKVSRNNSTKICCNKNGHEAYVFVPSNLDLRVDQVQIQIKHQIINYLRSEAKIYLPARVELQAKKFGLKYGKVKINNASTRWGSCSFNNNINLNVRLLMLPDHLSDYIILHELAHVLHKNHGPNFWNFLERIAGDAKFKAKQLKKFNLAELL